LRSVGVELIDPEYVSVIVELPVDVIWPSHSSESPGSLWMALVSLVHVAPPPLTDDTVIDGEYTPTERTNASPRCCGVTDNVEPPPLAKAFAIEPTVEMVGELVGVDVTRKPSPLY
jgi:hypothetical protein